MSQLSEATSSARVPPGASNVEDQCIDYEARQRQRSIVLNVCRLGLLALLLAFWEYGTGRWFDAVWFSSPSLIIADLISWLRGDLLYQLGVTLRETFLGYAFGTFAGIAAGSFLVRFDFLRRLLDPFIMSLNGIPRIAVAPLFIIWFGIGELSKIVLAALMTFFLCFYATLAGLRSVDKVHLDRARHGSE
jgi:NitT/TauT family transport system permease protein